MKSRRFGDAAADDNFGRRQGDDKARQPLPEIIEHLRAARIVGRNVAQRLAHARQHGRPCDQPLQTIAVERAYALENIAAGTRQANMAHFRMNQTVQRLSVDHHTAADTGTHGQIQPDLRALQRPPAIFTECRTVDVGVERDRHTKRLRQTRRDRGVGPAGLGRAGNMPPVGSRHIEPRWPERRDSNRRKTAAMQIEERLDCAQCLCRRGGGHGCFGQQPVGMRANGNIDLGPAQLDSGDHW